MTAAACDGDDDAVAAVVADVAAHDHDEGLRTASRCHQRVPLPVALVVALMVAVCDDDVGVVHDVVVADDVAHDIGEGL